MSKVNVQVNREPDVAQLGAEHGLHYTNGITYTTSCIQGGFLYWANVRI